MWLLTNSVKCVKHMFMRRAVISSTQYELTLTWFVVHHASKTHWATRFFQLLLSSAASSSSSQLMPIFLRSFLTTSFQFCRGRPGLLKPSGSHVRACSGSLWWSIRERCPSHLRRLHLIMSSSFGSAVASQTFSYVTLSFQEIPRILRCHLWCAASSFFHLSDWDWPQLCTVEQRGED